MRFIYAMLVVVIATTAFAQNRVTRPRSQVRIQNFATPVPVPTERPMYREDTVTINPDVRDPVLKRNPLPYSDLPPEYADTLLSADQQKQAAQQKFYKKEAVPILSPDGKELVGMVGNRYLTKDELAKRADLMMKTLPPPEKVLGSSAAVAIVAGGMPEVTNADDDKQREEDRRILIEGRVLDDWARTATLAVHAEAASREVASLRVSDAEVEQAIKKLSDQAQINSGKIPVALQTVMFSERELRQEIRDGLLVEKYMQEYVKRMVNEQEMLNLFKQTPALFIQAPKVRAWGMFIAKEGFETPSKARKTEKELGKWRGGLKSCKKVEDFKELGQKVVASESNVILSEMGWVHGTDNLEPEMKKALFTLKPGETSDVVMTINGYHIFKVLERDEGEKMDFAVARPRIADYLANSLKDAVYNDIKGQHGLQMAASGLKRYKIIGEAGGLVTATNPAATSATATVARPPVDVNNEPNLSVLRQRTGQRRFGASVPSVESVVGGRAAMRTSRPVNPTAAPKPFIPPAR